MKMNLKLGTNIEVGQKIKTSKGWYEVLEVTDEGVITKDGLVRFGEPVEGWPADEVTTELFGKTIESATWMEQSTGYSLVLHFTDGTSSEIISKDGKDIHISSPFTS